MKNIQNLLRLSFILCISISLNAQTKIKATTILNSIKNHKEITYKNVIITGVLDFTFMEDQLKNKPKKKKRWWHTDKQNYEETQIKSHISFENCTFQDPVYAYIHNEDTERTFIANFEEDVRFKNCTFKEEALFKYSNFEKSAIFSGSHFKDASTFKYAKFHDAIDFHSTNFEASSSFKYASFRKNVSFANSTFEESATFKYAKFENGVSFNRTQFNEDLDLKYTKVSGEFDITGMSVTYDIDAKYTKINGQPFQYN